jgi:hypothetical protein
MFQKSKIYKYIAFSLLLSTLFGTVIYSQLSNRHKAIIKTQFFHITGILNADWLVYNYADLYQMESPTFLIDGIYKSMEGPKASKYVQLNQKKELLWITGFEIKAFDSETDKELSNDFICHMNIDINDAIYYENFGLKNRIGKQYPRLTSLSHGLEKYNFPKGYAVPVYGNDFLFVTTQTLNHNIPKINKKVKHQVAITYENNSKKLKPLLSKTAYIQLPFDEYNPNKQPLDPGSNQCIPVETKNHTYTGLKGKKLSGHWKIPIGKMTYKSSIDEHLALDKPMRLHFAAPHVHPFATSIGIFDKTTGKMLFNCLVKNHKKTIGLDKISVFNSESGIWLHPNHKYEMVITCNNNSIEEQDMMGSMFLFFYDKELEDKIN